MYPFQFHEILDNNFKNLLISFSKFWTPKNQSQEIVDTPQELATPILSTVDYNSVRTHHTHLQTHTHTHTITCVH